jgi:23S rRNA pseudouridine955/2504/2580 synthase
MQGAVTRAKPLSYGRFLDNDVSLVEFTIETGRKHQIRAQSALHGFSLVGDAAYGAKRIPAKEAMPCEYFLHAAHIVFPKDNPVHAPEIIRAPLPDPFTKMLEKCLPNTAVTAYTVTDAQA